MLGSTIGESIAGAIKSKFAEADKAQNDRNYEAKLVDEQAQQAIAAVEEGPSSNPDGLLLPVQFSGPNTTNPLDQMARRFGLDGNSPSTSESNVSENAIFTDGRVVGDQFEGSWGAQERIPDAQQSEQGVARMGIWGSDSDYVLDPLNFTDVGRAFDFGDQIQALIADGRTNRYGQTLRAAYLESMSTAQPVSFTYNFPMWSHYIPAWTGTEIGRIIGRFEMQAVGTITAQPDGTYQVEAQARLWNERYSWVPDSQARDPVTRALENGAILLGGSRPIHPTDANPYQYLPGDPVHAQQLKPESRFYSDSRSLQIHFSRSFSFQAWGGYAH